MGIRILSKEMGAAVFRRLDLTGRVVVEARCSGCNSPEFCDPGHRNPSTYIHLPEGEDAIKAMTDALTEARWGAIPWTDHVVCSFCVERAREAPRTSGRKKFRVLVPPPLQDRVRDFFAIAEQVVADHPHVPDDGTVRLRMRLIAEEFLEQLEAAFAHTGEFELVRHHLHHLVDVAPVRVDLAKLVDAWADTDYVVEGARVAFGVDGEPVMALVHAANMAKAGGPVIAGKKMKPKGWVAPDVVGELRRQGWAG